MPQPPQPDPRPALPGLAACHAEARAALVAARRDVLAFALLALLRQALRLAPTLAIGLVVDRIAANRALATLAAIVSGLCVLALVEMLFARAQDATHMVLKAAISARGGGRRAILARATIIELIEALLVTPLVLGLVLWLFALASPRLALATALVLVLHAGVAVFAGFACRLGAWRLHTAETALETWQSQAETGDRRDGLQPAIAGMTARREAARHAAETALDTTRHAARRALVLAGRLGYALGLALTALEVIAGSLTPGGLIAALLLLRQALSLAEAGTLAWLRANEAAPRAAAPSLAATAPGTAASGGGGAARREAGLAAAAALAGLGPQGLLVLAGPDGPTALRALALVLATEADAAMQTTAATQDAAARPGWLRVGGAPRLFDLTLRDNLRLAAPESDDTRLAAALTVAGLAEAVARLPGGLGQACGPRGQALPEDIRRGLDLARALVAAPALLLVELAPERPGEDAAPHHAALLARLRAWQAESAGPRRLAVASSAPVWLAAADRVLHPSEERTAAAAPIARAAA
jgi:ABC-type protease/lipase transport system fused ATPase/permease subunit